jgi:hypothetical protein
MAATPDTLIGVSHELAPVAIVRHSTDLVHFH